MDTRRFILAMTLSFIVLYAWMFYTQKNMRSQEAASSQPAAQVATSQPAASQALAPADRSAEAPASTWRVESAATVQPVVLGQDDPAGTYQIQAVLTSRGAAVERVQMVAKQARKAKDGKPLYLYGATVENREPYEVLAPLTLPGGEQELSWQTVSVRLGEPEVTIPLSKVPWNVETVRAADGTYQARFWLDVYNAAQPVVRIHKRFTLAPGSFAMKMDLTFQPLGERDVDLVVDQMGAIGICREDPRGDNRKVYVVSKEKDRFKPEVFQHAGIAKKGPVEVGSAFPIAWTALADKYFAAITAPVQATGAPQAIARVKVSAFVQDPQAVDQGGDIAAQMFSPRITAAPSAAAQLDYDLYVGPKSQDVFSANQTYAARDYGLLRSSEYAWCTFSSLGELLTSFLHWLYYYIPPHNYGVAIIILVLLVRAILHPLTKHQQLSMAQMQQKQALVAPKVAAIKQKYPNDRQKQQLETMKIYREAGINPASQMAGCLPMLIQLPIWVALYSALNYDINLWHEPFMLWIRDLSAPDALWSWANPVNIPIVSWMIGPVTKLNVLPILLAVSMWAQQKFTPKPTPAPGTPKEQVDQQRQMQKMMGFMMIFMGLLFYNMPSGLNLYIMASSAFGALEQQRIRKHMERQKDQPANQAKGRSWMDRLMERVEKKAATSHTVRRDRGQ